MRREPGDVRPDYVLIAEDLRDQITSGAIRVGDPLPSQAALRDTYGTSQATAQKAMERLKKEGYVTGAVGRGTFVISTQPHADTQDDTKRMLTDVNQRLDELETAVRELKYVVVHGHAPDQQPGPTHA